MIKKRVANSVAFGTRLAPSTAKQVRAFSKKNKMPISTITNSALRYFMAEAKNIADVTEGKSFNILPLTGAAAKNKKEVDMRVKTSRIYK
jgi:peptidoglycan hydrolase-like protein with peptidoglycan-binding domain